MIDIRPFDFEKDWSQFCRLYHAVYGRQVDQAYVNWKFLENPAGEAFGYGAWDGENLVGFVSLTPYRFCIQGEEHTASQGADTMVLKDYRGQGLFTKLTQRLLEEMNRRGWLWRYSAPGPMSYPGYVSKLGHRQVTELPYLVKLRSIRILKSLLRIGGKARETAGFRMAYHSYRVRMLREFDERFDQLWERTKKDHKLSVVKSSAHLNWRFARHPFYRYQTLTVEDDGRLKGFAVIRGGNLLEMYGEVDSDLYKALAKAADKVWRSQGQDISHAWILGDNLAFRALKNQGWTEWRSRFRPFGLYPRQPLIVYPNPGQEKAAMALKAGYWRFSMGDVDCM